MDFRPAAFALAVLLVLAAPAAAGEEEAPPKSVLGEVMARLASDEPAEKAWGCYLAGRDGHQDAVPQVVDVLRSNVEPYDKTWSLVHRAALDALIRLDARVPDALLARHDRRLAIHVLVLRARDPEAHVEALRARFDKALSRKTLGAFAIAHGNLLLQTRAAGFAVRLLGLMKTELRVHVFTPKEDGFDGIGVGGGMGGGFGTALAKVPEGFPPYSWYGLEERATAHATLLANGPRPVYVKRRERADPGIVGGGRSWTLDRAKLAAEWAASLLGTDTEAIGLPDKKFLSVAWTGAETDPMSFRDKVVAARDAQAAPVWRVARRLLEARLLTRAEAYAFEPDVVVEIEDTREDRATALPELPALERPAWARRPAESE